MISPLTRTAKGRSDFPWEPLKQTKPDNAGDEYKITRHIPPSVMLLPRSSMSCLIRSSSSVT